MHHLEVPIILVVIGTFVVLLAALFLGRQFVVARARGSFECLLWRRAVTTGRPGWQLGVMRYGTERLRWFRAFSMRVRPEVSIRRSGIADVERRSVQTPLPDVEPQVLLIVRMDDGSEHRMLLESSAASGVMAWFEAAPAGSLVSGTD